MASVTTADESETTGVILLFLPFSVVADFGVSAAFLHLTLLPACYVKLSQSLVTD